tara:strand:- start:314 stop:463 length:150 start_codon:yes stop_codon:yes gene_type:complete
MKHNMKAPSSSIRTVVSTRIRQILTIMDSVAYERIDGRNRTTMTMALGS